MRRNYYNPNEPANSYEVSYVLALFRPNIKIEVTLQELTKRLDYDRRTILRQWAADNMSYKWVKDHI